MGEIQDKFVRMVRVPAVLDVHRATMYRWIAEGRLPAPRQIGPHATGYLMSDLLKFMRGEK